MARILVIEDETALREALAEGFRSAGHEVVTAESAQDARAHLKDTFDAILTDLQAPCDGLLNLERARETDPEVPVLVMSGAQESSIPEEVLSHGAFAFLPKPVTLEELSSELARALEEGPPERRGVIRRLKDLQSACQPQPRRLMDCES